MEQIIQKNILEAKVRIRKSLQPDLLIIFFTRIIEDLKNNPDTEFYGRITELNLLINPYNTKEKKEEIFKEFLSEKIDKKFGIKLDEQEIGFINIFRENLTKECKLKNPKVMKGRLNGILKILTKKYLPESSQLIEPFILGKLISFFGGIKNLYYRPSSTIQLIGAEIALFRHKSTESLSPKYGIIYHSKFIQQEKNKGKAARQLANNLSKSIKIDYFRKFYEN